MPAPTTETFIARLAAAGIPAAGSDGEREVRAVLARMLFTNAIRFADLQLARDLAGLRPECRPFAGHPLLVAALCRALHGGSSFLRTAAAPGLLARAACSPDEDDAANAAAAEAARAAWEAFAAPNLGLFAFDPIVESFGPETLAFQRQWRDVDAVNALLRSLRDGGAGSADVAPVAPAFLESAMRFSFELDDDQRAAVKCASSSRFAVITGGPGTGKTTIVCAILRALLSSGTLRADQIALAAPTGRAAQRMGETIVEECGNAVGLDDGTRQTLRGLAHSTVHALLGGLAPRFAHHADNPLPHRLVVVDEVSMVGVPLMRALLEALPEDCRLVLIGDADQLPSVETGAVLGDLVGDARSPFIVRLGNTHRFNGRLKNAAEGINAGSDAVLRAPEARRDGDNWTDGFDGEPPKGEFFLRTLPADADEAAKATREAVDAWAGRFGFCAGDGALVRAAKEFRAPVPGEDGTFPASEESDALFKALERSRILAAVHGGPFGVRAINRRLFLKRLAAERGKEHGKARLRPLDLPGVPVIVTRNTPDRQLFNGDVGIVVLAGDGRNVVPTVVFPRGERVVSCPAALLPEHDLAYASTIHKSQGSQYDNVLVVLPASATCPLLTRQILYTGVTRARKRAVLLASASALAAALDPARANAGKRDTGVSL